MMKRWARFYSGLTLTLSWLFSEESSVATPPALGRVQRLSGNNNHLGQLDSFLLAKFFVLCFLKRSVLFPSSFSLAWVLQRLLGKWHQLRWEEYKHKSNSSTFLASATPGESWRDIFLHTTQGKEATPNMPPPSGSQPRSTMCPKPI